MGIEKITAPTTFGGQTTTCRRGARTKIAAVRCAIVSIALLALGGCEIEQTHNGPIFDPAKIAQIRKGESTMADVEALFGKALALNTRVDGRKVANYTASDTRTNPKLNPNDKSSYSPFLSGVVTVIDSRPGNIGRGPYEFTTNIEILEVDYSSAGIVEDVLLSNCDRGICAPVPSPGR